jgi:hypothetical protein
MDRGRKDDLVLRRPKRTTWRLKKAIDRLPTGTRAAMLAGLESQEIIVGAYTARSGGVCPMLAAHRLGARTEARAFAAAWDSFAGARRPRRAHQRELELLEAMLQESLHGEIAPPAIAPVTPTAPAPAPSREVRAREMAGSR